MAGRIDRHTNILRGIAHELSNAPDREDRPATAAEAKARFDAHLERLANTTPRAGLGAATGAFIDDLTKRAGRYGEHLFVCFSDPRIPATTNELEGAFGGNKRTLRHSIGAGSTTNSVMSNLGADAFIAHQYLKQPQSLASLRTPASSLADFESARERIAREEAPAIRQRSMVRRFDNHLTRLANAWRGREPRTDADA